MGQLVTDQLPTGLGSGHILVGTEHHMIADRECSSRKRSCRVSRVLVGVDADPAEIVPKTGFHKGSSICIEGTAL